MRLANRSSWPVRNQRTVTGRISLANANSNWLSFPPDQKMAGELLPASALATSSFIYIINALPIADPPCNIEFQGDWDCTVVLVPLPVEVPDAPVWTIRGEVIEATSARLAYSSPCRA